jgi:hypothetical protein
MDNGTETPSTAARPVLMGDAYVKLISEKDSAEAEEYISEQLKQCVVEGDIETVAKLYAHRAVWRMQLGLLRKAVKDLQAALRCKISAEAEVDVRILLSQCYREMSSPEDAAQEEKQAMERAATMAHVPVLALKHILAGGSKSKATTRANVTAKIAAKAQPDSSEHTESNGSDNTDKQTKALRQRGGSMGAGFLISPRASTAVSTNPAISSSAGSATESGAVHADGAAHSMHHVVALPKAAVSYDKEDDDEEPVVAAHRGGGVTITDVDADELEKILSTPIKMASDPKVEARLRALQGLSMFLRIFATCASDVLVSKSVDRPIF